MNYDHQGSAMPKSDVASGVMIGGDAARKATPFEEAGRTFAGVHDLAARIETLADRLVGAEPATETNVERDAEPNSSLMHGLSAGARRAEAATRRAHADLDRIQRMLGD